MRDRCPPVDDRGPADVVHGGFPARALLDARRRVADVQSALPGPWWSMVVAVGATAIGLVEWPVALGVACVYATVKLWPVGDPPQPRAGAA